jgi:hypothetical protein
MTVLDKMGSDPRRLGRRKRRWRGGPVKTVPQVRQNVRVMDLGSELMVCDDARELVHVLNTTARRIWDLCDGTHDPDDIVDAVRQLFPEISSERVRQDVEQALKTLEDKELLVWTEPEIASDERR